MFRTLWLCLCVALLGAAAAAAQPAQIRDTGICNQLFGPPIGVKGFSGTRLPPRTSGVFDVCFDGDVWQLQSPPDTRITSKDPVWIRVRHFNFLRYALAYDVKEEQSQAYAYLSKLWSSVLNPDLGALALATLSAGEEQRAQVPKIIEASRVVYQNAQNVQRKIEAAIAPHKRPGLTPDEVKALRAASDDVKAAADALDKSYDELQKLAESDAEGFKQAFGGGTAKYYKLATDSYDAASSRLDSFTSLAERSLADEVHKIGTRDAGTRVTVTLSSSSPDGDKKDFETITYFVQSSMPLVAHGGVVITGIKDTTFEKVTRAAQFSQEDLFQAQGTGDAIRSFSLFLGWQFFTKSASLQTDAKQQPLSLLLSIGTDIASPGSRIMVGPSAMLFGRFVVTGGLALGKESTGVDPVEPDVYRAIKDNTVRSWFASASIRIY